MAAVRLRERKRQPDQGCGRPCDDGAAPATWAPPRSSFPLISTRSSSASGDALCTHDAWLELAGEGGAPALLPPDFLPASTRSETRISGDLTAIQSAKLQRGIIMGAALQHRPNQTATTSLSSDEWSVRLAASPSEFELRCWEAEAATRDRFPANPRQCPAPAPLGASLGVSPR
ncbi:hypothetical protein OBBRIDRAFT_267002 [Obba rivulosa]|uniref:Uncharacterized protein n=1 Tax=Obba rivulosa TaxID=1052685 RepID=A0A8E2J3A7_9APHY|nr:hypothetical protein OBBRIDRAFT_267002 [Obba rivulosa]